MKSGRFAYRLVLARVLDGVHTLTLYARSCKFLNSWSKSPEQVSPACLLKAGLDAFFLSLFFFFITITCIEKTEIKDLPGRIG